EGGVACHHVVRREPRRAVRRYLAGAVPAAAHSDTGLVRLALAVKIYRDSPERERFGVLGGLDQARNIDDGHVQSPLGGMIVAAMTNHASRWMSQAVSQAAPVIVRSLCGWGS